MNFAVARWPGGQSHLCKLDFVGMTNLLALRAKFAGTQPVSPDRYIDESYYRDALAPLQPANPGPGGQQLN